MYILLMYRCIIGKSTGCINFLFKGVQLERIQGVLVEYLLVLSQFKFPARQFILEMFINLAVQTKQ